MTTVLYAIVNLILVVLLAPLCEGISRKLTARIQSRKGPPVLQPYYDLLKLLGKEDIESGESPAMQRFAAWLSSFLPVLPKDGSAKWLAPGIVTDRTDGKLIHLDGLNLSRAWMLRGIAAGLPKGDARVRTLRATADAHAKASLPSVTSEHYEGSHWLGTFAVYLLTGRGLPPHLPR